MKQLTNKKMTTASAEKNGGSAASSANRRSKTAAPSLKSGSQANTGNGQPKSKPIATAPDAPKAKRTGTKGVGPTPKLKVGGEPRAASTNQQPPAPRGKLGLLVGLLRHTDGATLPAMMAATGWQAHSVRGAMAGAIKKKLGLNIVSEITGTTRHWRIVEQGA